MAFCAICSPSSRTVEGDVDLESSFLGPFPNPPK